MVSLTPASRGFGVSPYTWLALSTVQDWSQALGANPHLSLSTGASTVTEEPS
jgi:hypothetical protein